MPKKHLTSYVNATQHGLLILDFKITGDWKYIMSEVTDKHGRITYNLPPEHSVGYGLYPVRMVVRGDHSCLHMTLACLPPKTETVRHKALEINLSSALGKANWFQEDCIFKFTQF